VKCESGKVELPGNNIKKCILVTMSDLSGKSIGELKSHGLHRKWLIKQTDEGSRRLSKNNEELQKTE